MNTIRCSQCGKIFSTKGIGSHVWRVHGDGKNFKPGLGKSAWSHGKTKETSESIKRASEKLKRIKSDLEIELDDDSKLKRKWSNKRVNAKKENIEFNLTFDEYCKLVKEAGLKSSQLGFSGEGYVLARYNDVGAYEYGNCRFITHAENVKEKKISDKMRLSSKKSASIMNEHNRQRLLTDRDAVSKSIKDGQQNSEKYKNMLERKHVQHMQYLRRKQESINLNPKRLQKCGIHNSQYGTFWITDGVHSKKWRDSYGEIPNGFYRGRVC